MSRKRMMFTIGGTAFLALGAGAIMQMGGGASQQSDVHPVSPVQQAVIAPPAMPFADDAALDLTGITLTSAQPDFQPPATMPMPRPVPELESGETETSAAMNCEVTATATPAALASVDLTVEAPCFRNDRATVHHGGMIFTDTTDARGQLRLTVPALSSRAVFIVAFANGKGAVATAQVPDLEDVDRVVLQWSGHSGFELHALEFGASYGEPGHVWLGADAAQGGAAGSVVRLGDAGTLEPQLAEVYTFPAGSSARSGTVNLSVEAEVTIDNCGRDISAQSLELHRDTGLRTRDLVLSVPNCTAVGDFLVLNNLLDDLKIAAR